jgi:hypothetical protein
MDSPRFEGLTRTIDRHLSRRLLGRVASLGVLTGLALVKTDMPGAAARRRPVRDEHNIRGNKAVICFEGSTIRVPKKKRKKYLARGATRGKCKPQPTCTPVCTGCGGPDGCGGTCPGCAAGSICIDNACQSCTITCDDTPDVCGEALQTELEQGGAIILCPGLYEGTFLPTEDAEIYGAGGNTDDPSISTILTASEGSRVISITEGVTLLLTGVRVAYGDHPSQGGGILVNHDQAELVIQHSVITENQVTGPGGTGGGIANTAGTVTISHSEISFNTASSNGGGIYNAGTATTSLAPTVTITENTATTGTGGGIYRASGTVNLNGASVKLNSPDQCDGVTCP